jgi:hypothetical protein
MSLGFAGLKTQLEITQLQVKSDGSFTPETGKDATFKAMLNPTEFKHTRAICYNTRMVPGQSGSQTKFSGIKPDTVTFALLLDGTGVVQTFPFDPTMEDVKTQVAKLVHVVHEYESKEHEPSHVLIVWGTMKFRGRLQSMSTQYTLFKPSGDPLRAKVDLSFTGFMSKTQSGLEANPSSPDLSHLVEVREGDTLPLLCNRIYGDPGYYREVADFNKLDSFRRLTPGLKLRFPPLA